MLESFDEVTLLPILTLRCLDCDNGINKSSIKFQYKDAIMWV
jgi:hypothetical protein